MSFDLGGNGVVRQAGWTNSCTKEELPTLDLDGDGAVVDGRELFGDATQLPNGDRAANGFIALAAWDNPEMGGDGNGRIDENDLIWTSLRLWIDRNHDGISQPAELLSLGERGVRSLSLTYQEVPGTDPSGNAHRFQSTFVRRVVRTWGAPYDKTSALHDVYFAIRHEDGPAAP